MLLTDTWDLFEYWLDHPPVHDMVAAYLEIKPRRSKKPISGEQPSQSPEMMRKLFGGGAKLSQMPAHIQKSMGARKSEMGQRAIDFLKPGTGEKHGDR